MTDNSSSAALRRAAFAWLAYLPGILFFSIASESTAGVVLGRIGIGVILLSSALQFAALRSADFPYACRAELAAILAGIASAVLPLLSSAVVIAYVSDLLGYMMLLSVLTAGCMEMLAALHLLQKKKNRRAEKSLAHIKRFLIVFTVSVVLRVISATLGTMPLQVAFALFLALCSGLCGVAAGCLIFFHLRADAKALTSR